jgi:hypothetical protein
MSVGFPIVARTVTIFGARFAQETFCGVLLTQHNLNQLNAAKYKWNSVVSFVSLSPLILLNHGGWEQDGGSSANAYYWYVSYQHALFFSPSSSPSHINRAR